MSLKKIIVATDLSNHADFALKRAILLANNSNVSLELIHVIKQPWPISFVPFSGNNQQEELLRLEKNIEKKLQNLVKDYPSVLINTSVLLGRQANQITQFADDNKADLIIVGAHGQYHISDYVLGTTSGDIIRQAKKPVLLIKKSPSSSYNKILIATDFSKASKKAIIAAFNYFPNAKYQLLHIVDIYYQQFLTIDTKNSESDNPTTNIFNKLNDFLADCDIPVDEFEQKIIGGYLADTIIMQTKQWDADLLVFGTQGHSKLHYLLMGSVAKRLVQLSNIDMLTVSSETLL